MLPLKMVLNRCCSLFSEPSLTKYLVNFFLNQTNLISVGAITIKPESSASTKDISQQLWQVVRDCDADGNGYLLKCNDIIKVGRVIFKLKQVESIDFKTLSYI